MKVLKAKGSREIRAIMVGDSTIFIPSGYDPEEIIGSFIWDQTQTGVPITQIQVSLLSWLRFIEQVYQKFIEIGQPEIARQILPRGRGG